jgi:hypothetical protein
MPESPQLAALSAMRNKSSLPILIARSFESESPLAAVRHQHCRSQTPTCPKRPKKTRRSENKPSISCKKPIKMEISCRINWLRSAFGLLIPRWQCRLWTGGVSYYIIRRRELQPQRFHAARIVNWWHGGRQLIDPRFGEFGRGGANKMGILRSRARWR